MPEEGKGSVDKVCEDKESEGKISDRKTPETAAGKNFTYMLRCADGSYYVGWTNDLDKRLATHQAGRGGKYTRTHLPVELAYFETFSTKQEAMSREWHLKRLTHQEKESLIKANQK